MIVDLSTVTTAVMTVSAAVVVLYGLLLLTKMQHDGDLGRLLARAVVDPKTRATILLGVGSISAMFLAMGFLHVAQDFGLLSNVQSDVVTSVVFLAGSGTLVYLTQMGVAMAHLSLENELDLRDAAPDVYDSLGATDPTPSISAAAMYAAFPVEEAPGLGVGTTYAVFGAFP